MQPKCICTMMKNTVNEELLVRLRQFIEDEMRSCSMDLAGITPEYVQRMWGGTYIPASIHNEAMLSGAWTSIAQ